MTQHTPPHQKLRALIHIIFLTVTAHQYKSGTHHHVHPIPSFEECSLLSCTADHRPAVLNSLSRAGTLTRRVTGGQPCPDSAPTPGCSRRPAPAPALAGPREPLCPRSGRSCAPRLPAERRRPSAPAGPHHPETPDDGRRRKGRVKRSS